MPKTLKKQYEVRQVRTLHERVRTADAQVLAENRLSTLLIEAMDEEDLQKVSAIIDKLNKIKSPELPKLTAAIEQAQAELNKYTAGGPLTKAWTKLKSLAGVDNPIVKITTFADALERGFSQIPTILKNNGINLKNADLSKSLATVLSTPNGQRNHEERGSLNMSSAAADTSDTVDTAAEGVTNEATINAQNKLNSVVNQLRTALSPGGVFGVFKKVPYIDSATLAKELVAAPLNVFSRIAKQIQSGTKAAEVAPDLKQQVTGAGGAETKHTAGETPTKQTGQTQPSTSPKPTTSTNPSTPTGQDTPKPQGGGANLDPQKAILQKLKSSNILQKLRLNDAGAVALLKVLDEMGALKSPS